VCYGHTLEVRLRVSLTTFVSVRCFVTLSTTRIHAILSHCALLYTNAPGSWSFKDPTSLAAMTAGLRESKNSGGSNIKDLFYHLVGVMFLLLTP